MKKIKALILFLFIFLFICQPQPAFSLNAVQLGPEYFPNSSKGTPLSNADIYVGLPDTDPEIVVNQKQVSVLQEDGTIVEISQPVNTGGGGVPLYLGSPVTILVTGDYSLKVLNSSGSQIYYVPNTSASVSQLYIVNASEPDQGAAGGGNSVKDLVDTIGATSDETMIFPRRTSGNTTVYTFLTSETIPDNIEIQFANGALVKPADGITLTAYSPEHIIAGKRQQIIDMTNNSTDPLEFTVDGLVYADLWGAKGDNSTDRTDAIVAALATGSNVNLNGGTYLHTGGLNINTVHQRLSGAGRAFLGSDSEGTTLKKSSGTSVGVTLGNNETELSYMTIDNNSLAGNAVKVTAHSSHLRDIRFKSQGGTDFALYLSSINWASFENLIFSDGNYGGIEFDSSNQNLYSVFRNIRLGNMTGDVAIKLRYSTMIEFYSLYVEDEIDITSTGAGDAITDIFFNGIGFESALTTSPLIDINGAANVMLNINFYNTHIFQTADSAHALFDITLADGVIIEGGGWRDNAASAGKPWIVLDNNFNVKLSNLSIRGPDAVAGYFVDCNGKTLSRQVKAENIYARATGTFSNRWKTSGLVVKNTNIAQTFEVGSDSNTELRNITGTITWTNIGARVSSSGTSTTPLRVLADEGTPSVKGGKFWRTGGTTAITEFDDSYEGQIIIVFAEHSIKITEGGTIALSGSADFDMTATDTLTLIRKGSLWYEAGRGDNGA